MLALELTNLTKSYGRNRGVIDLNLSVEVGEVFGFLGPNGAGKTTTIRTLLDLIRPTSGSARILGLDSVADSLAVRRRIGYLPSELSLWDWMTTRQALEYLGQLRGGVDTAFRDQLMEQFAVEPDRRIRDLSTGNKQKIGIIQAFMHRPELVILDEPTSGLDPLMQQAVYAVISEFHAQGRTVVLSSHVLPEVERIAHRVGIIRMGELVTVETVENLKSRAVHQIEIRFGSNGPDQRQLAAVPGVAEVTMNGSVAMVRVEGSMDHLIKALSGHEVTSIHTHDTPLEEIFLSMYQGGN